MIVNNAAQQPDDIVSQEFYQEGQEKKLWFSADSMGYLFCLSLGNAIAESPLFDDVRLCTDTLRKDSNFFVSRPFSPSEIKSFCDLYDVDALITLDKMYFKPQFEPTSLNYPYVFIQLIGELKAVYPGSQVAQAITFSDSIYIAPYAFEFYYSREPFQYTSQDVMAAMRSLSEYTGQRLHTHFVPHWISDSRWVFTSFSSEWKRATAYARADKWEMAATEWRASFEKTKQWKKKAFLASNLALCHEIAGDFAKAIEYAETADSLFKQNANEDHKFRKWQHKYLEQLKKRSEDDKTISLQLREAR